LKALGQRLRDRGYVEGQHLVIAHWYADGRAEYLPALAAELVQLQVEVMVAAGTQASIPFQATEVMP
jgi:hypothetical protein